MSNQIITDFQLSAKGRTFKKCPKDFQGTLIVPETVREIARFAFADCTGLKSIILLSSLRKIGFCSFNGCTALEIIILPDSVKEIDLGAFLRCTSLKTAILQSNLQRIGTGIFCDCPNLTNVVCLVPDPKKIIVEKNTANHRMFLGVEKQATLFVPKNAIKAYKRKAPWKYFKEIKSIPDY